MTAAHADGIGDPCQELERTLQELTRLFAKLDTLSRMQKPLIDEENIDRLLRVLNDRQAVITEIEGLSPSFERGLALFDAKEDALAPDRRDQIAHAIDAFQTLADRVAARDRESMGMLTSRRDEVGSMLCGMGRQSAAVHAYAGGRSRQPVARYQDREG